MAEIGIQGDKLKVGITNISSQDISLDRDLDLFTSISITDTKGKLIIPKIRHKADIHEKAKCPEGFYDERLDIESINLDKKLVRLSPGERVCKTFSANEYIAEYQFASSFEGRTSISRYLWKMPDMKDIAKISIEYDAGDCWKSDMLTVIANTTEQKVPEDLYEKPIQINWERRTD